MELLMMRSIKEFNSNVMTWSLVISILALLVMPYSSDAATTFGGHTESVEDMRVKVLGGYIRVNRSWESKGWRINRRWDPAGLHWQSSQSCWTAYVNAAGHTVPGGCIGHSHFAGFQRNGVTYSLHREVDIEEADGTLVTKWEALVNPESYFIARIQPDTASSLPYGTEGIAPTVLSLRWENMNGDWVEYEKNPTTGQNFRPVKYGDKNNVTVTFAYDANGNLLGVSDHLGRQILWYEYDADKNIKLIRDYSGRKVEYGYNAAKQLTSVTDLRGFVWGYTYNSQGYLESITDPNNNKTTYSYTASNALSSVTDPLGNKTTYKFEYDKTAKEFYKQEKTPGGKITEAWYNENGDLLRQSINGSEIRKIKRDGYVYTETSNDGNDTIRVVNKYKQVIKITFPDGSVRTTEYVPGTSFPTRKANEKGIVTLYEYDSNWNLKKLTEAAGTSEQRITTYTYDDYGDRLTTTIEADAMSASVKTSATYDEYGNALTQTDGEGNVTNYTYDVMGNVLTNVRLGNRTWTYTYDDAGKALTITDPLDNVTSVEYDKAGNKIKVTDAMNNITQYRYDALDRLTKVTNALNQVITLDYGVNGDLVAVTGPLGVVVQMQYDLSGRLLKHIDTAGNVTKYSYVVSGNGAGKVSSIQYPTYTEEYYYDNLSRVNEKVTHLSAAEILRENYGYDALGNRNSITDAKGRTTLLAYNARGQIEQTTNPKGGVTKYAYDNQDNLLSVTNARNIVIRTYTYDGNGRNTAEIWPDGRKVQYGYDDLANTVTRIDAKGQVTRYLKDDAGRIEKVDYFVKEADTTPIKTIIYDLNALGKPMTVSDGTIILGRTYTALSQMKSESINYGTFSLAYQYGFNDAGRKESLTRPDGKIINYTYDNAGQLSSITLPGAGTLTWNGYQWTAPTSLTLPGGSSIQWSYDALMRPSLINSKDTGDNSILSYNYIYDKVGNISERKTEHGNYLYSYDELDRLISATNPTLNDEAYTYDEVGNRLTDSKDVGDWVYGDDNSLDTRPGVTYKYDANGSMTEKNDNGTITRYVYDVTGRMTEVRDSNDNLIASYTYDPFGRRIKKIVNGTSTYFLYSEEGLIAEADSAGNITRQYGWKPGGAWGTDPLYLIDGVETYYYQNDHLGTPQKLFSQSGAVVWSVKYESFGLATVDTATVNNPLRFPGQYYDRETATYYNYSRDYDPSVGRYVESDPIGLKGGMNTYLYVGANPVIYSDRYGLSQVDLGDWNCLYTNPTECFFGHAYEDAQGAVRQTLVAIGTGSARRECEGYMSCLARCEGAVIGLEVATTGLIRGLESAAKVIAAAKAAAFISGAGVVLTAVSGFQAVQCTWSCAKLE